MPENTRLPCMEQTIQLSVVTEKGQMNLVDASLQGVVDAGYKDFDDSWLLMPLSMGQGLFDTKKASFVGISLDSDSDATTVRDVIHQAAVRSGREWEVSLWQDHQIGEIFRSNEVILKQFRNFVFLIVVIVIALSTSNSIIRSVHERAKEIACLRALGFRPQKIAAMFAMEGALLGCLGVVSGFALELIMVFAINFSGITYVPGLIAQPVPLRIAYTPVAAIVISLVLVLAAMVIAWFASRNASRRNIASSFADA